MDIKQKASLFAVITAFILASSKFSVGFISGSLAIISSSLDSLLDTFMSGMNFFAIKKAGQPADDSHQYGHGKVEDLAAVAQSVVVVFSGVFIIYKAVESYMNSVTITYSLYDFLVMIISLALSFAIVLLLRRIGKQTGSNALLADALHYTSDLFSNSGAILAIALTHYTGNIYYDLLFAIIIGCIIIFSAVKIARSGISGIMDSSISEKMTKEIERIIQEMPFPAVGFHKLRTRHSGSTKYIDFHMLFCKRLLIDEAHELANNLESEISREVKNADVVIHIEPCNYECDLTEATCTIRLGRKT
ncbi:MAG TPA: cation diffusion facilitator family transporter [Syntrophorhabdus sp.]|jgi:cation diffusion facilitator family transporter|nr:MAG: Ferrous-iron efflux pump FieF [Deltaproteobacteria bacterium ADurb.Bin135]HNS77080.1 cation diffusion facilitator family transporter [Syntrophorhabdus sp.]HOD77135.1 cation diffusion facilitator family transporter [Syntrophorhabdus sp.]HOH27791.1 cation diffusion facilitator family transporter [Syntrophorhabdus sp.]HPW37140.1 cation diffusion facilitator family transporter [Syntrophorhabdus sp.]